MFARLVLVFLCALAVTASPSVVRRDSSIVSLPIARRLNFTGTSKLIELDRARAKSLKNQPIGSNSKKTKFQTLFDVSTTNGLVQYTASVGVGTPAVEYTLIVDTGSSNTWVGANPAKPFKESSSTQSTGQLVEVTYGSGFFFGEEFLDTVTIGSAAIKGQSIGAALLSEDFEGVDGIVGIGPVDPTDGTTSGGGTIPTVVDNLLSQGFISTEEIGISFEPATSESSVNGELDFGGTDSSKFTGTISFVPLTTTSPASEFVGIDQSITYGSASGTSILAETAGIVDTGTTLLLIASNAIEAYQTATGAVEDETTGLLKLTSAQFAKLESLFFKIGSTTFEFTANAQLWPRSLNSAIGGTADDILLIVGNIGTPSGEGFDFVNGMVFLERFYFVDDTTNKRVGFATTSFTDATTN